MAYKNHPAFQAPAALNQKIWRYMSFGRFAYLIMNRRLWFARLDKLNDAFEGSLTEPQLMALAEKYRQAAASQPEPNRSEILSALGPGWSSSSNQFCRKAAFVNCWHCNDDEADAMWKIYCKGEGVAIQSTYERLCNSLNAHQLHDIYVGVIRYVDYTTESIPISANLLNLMCYKRRAFSHEKELRAAIWDITGKPWEEPYSGPEGIAVEVDINTLIESIWVAPKSDLWLRDLIEELCKQYAISVSVRRSEMDRMPWRPQSEGDTKL